MAKIIKFPENIRPKSASFFLKAHTTTFTNPFSNTTQTQEMPGAVWTFKADFYLNNEDKKRIFRAFIAKLRGSAGRFYFPAEFCPKFIPSFGESETPRIVDLSVTADEDDWFSTSLDITADSEHQYRISPLRTLSVVNPTTLKVESNKSFGELVLKAGQYISFDLTNGYRYLGIVTDDCFSLSDNTVQISIEPPLSHHCAIYRLIMLRFIPHAQVQFLCYLTMSKDAFRIYCIKKEKYRSKQFKLDH
ncbi:hypothetical protein [Actinobacillus pleuropneumoniae]|uniref:hypothetical protein n=1 Tax=Actinobacillus pleuropneumoniae TaxID=715 RepID=UPI0001E49710|nr:hypothetical protein [Actinobacillus pleuropneumoniae]EFM94585.1 hypothetical protein appser9_5780 [Actinobacillus pleuropneumoniae serovar 9 str. CVJ13261]EFM98995.1 hypothetical protein appser11_5860 [Actinobacillus pleuropneumoniae serovar 11 str. 56153]MCL7709095.1 hypothetical protein [Actinobacillus pleuropneumoniae]MCL7711492.1 hypothetical protein [Actinobacillus pleuropneumoniae]MCL7717348.1 hypothetical protein [Actinobacillus pleuropneumoniae]